MSRISPFEHSSHDIPAFALHVARGTLTVFTMLTAFTLLTQGKTVLVKTNSGSDFKGILHCLDGFLNIALEHCEEWSNGECRRTYGDAFIRGNNVTFISLVSK